MAKSRLLPPWKKSRVRVYWISLIHLFYISIATISCSCSSSSSSASNDLLYKEHCNSIVPESKPTDLKLSPSEFLQIQNGYYHGGDRILNQNHQSLSSSLKSVAFHPTSNLYTTETEGVLKVEADLIFAARIKSSRVYPSATTTTTTTSGGNKYQVNLKPHVSIPVRRAVVSFKLQGFWSESSGKLCMVGSSSVYSKEGDPLHISAVFKLNYPKNSTIFTSLITGTLESLNNVDNLNYFEPISILAFSRRNYDYSLISNKDYNVCSGSDDEFGDPTLGLDPIHGICWALARSSSGFELAYGSDCGSGGKNCSNPLGFLPAYMSFSGIQCSDDKKLRLLVGFFNSSYDVFNHPFVPHTTLVGEGVWDGETHRLCIAACRILSYTDSLANASIGDCSFRLTLRFPAKLSIRNRSNVVGQIWSNKTMTESGYFDKVVFQSSETRSLRVPGLKYEYTEIDRVVKLCGKKKTVGDKGKRYPNGYSSDMKFDMTVKDNHGRKVWGYSVPLSVGNRFYRRSPNSLPFNELPGFEGQINASNSYSLNVSYRIQLRDTPDFHLLGQLPSNNISLSLNKLIDIAAEGIYDTKTGSLCMVGCRSNPWKPTSDSKDCGILINVQFAPLDAKNGDAVKGTIESTWNKSDPLYFERLEFSSASISVNQARESIWRMDLEITMVLITNTLVCVFVGLQLFYVKKHPDVTPSISLLMLILLTLGHMIPLVLNFEALFVTNRNRQNVLIGSGGWLEVNEVIVRVVTMVAFLLQFRLLQLTWSTRLVDGNQKGLWVAEKKAIFVSLPLFVVGGLIAWIIHWLNNYYEAPLPKGPFHGTGMIGGYQRHSLLGDLRSYAGLVLDSFLFPQIMFNLFWNSKDKALSPAFYLGTTAVRLLPHAYDLYRAHSGVPDFSYIYANHGADFFSTAWDVIIPCGGLLFAGLIYLQQRFGGRCVLPQRFKKEELELAVYEKVPVSNG